MAKKPESTANWDVVDLTGMSDQERKDAAQAALNKQQIGQSRRNKVDAEESKVSKKTRKQSENVKSEKDDRASAPDATGNARVREAITDEVIDSLLSLIAGGKSMVRACEMPGMPNRTSFLRRVAEDVALQRRYALAMEARADIYAEQTIDIADDGQNDTYIDEEGLKRTDYDVVARSKLRIAARQWYASKIAPKKYGDKLALGGAEDLPPIKALTDDDLAAKIAEKMAKAAGQ